MFYPSRLFLFCRTTGTWIKDLNVEADYVEELVNVVWPEPSPEDLKSGQLKISNKPGMLINEVNDMKYRY